MRNEEAAKELARQFKHTQEVWAQLWMNNAFSATGDEVENAKKTKNP